MHLSLSKVMKLCGCRLGLGIRITKKNAAYMWIILLMVVMFQLMWSMMILCFWLIYAVMYGIIWCIGKIFKAIGKGLKRLTAK